MATLKEITKLYQDTFPTDDVESIAIVAAVIVGSRLRTPPVWLYLVGPSSGGKSQLVTSFSKIDFCHSVSDLTTNTFLSGASNNSRETSLLKRLGLNFVVIMKDFTTILSKSDETQETIIGQMREIYDGHMVKETGNGQKLEWGGEEKGMRGKATFIMAATEAIYGTQEKFADMGTRATNYVLKPIDRRAMTRAALRNNTNLETRVEEIQTAFRDFIMEKVRSLPPEGLPDLPNDIEEDIIEVSDFSSLCRSVVQRDYRGEKKLALSAEMPARMARQLLSQAQVLTFINGGALEPHLKDAVFKLGFDSIPKQRRLALDALARFRRVTAGGVGDYMSYPPERAKEWIEDLAMFGICRRTKVKNKTHWELKEEYRKIMLKYQNVSLEAELLEGEDESEGEYSAGAYPEIDRHYDLKEEINESANVANKMFDNM